MKRGIQKGERKATLKIARTMPQNGINGINCNTAMKIPSLTEEDLQRIIHRQYRVAFVQTVLFQTEQLAMMVTSLQWPSLLMASQLQLFDSAFSPSAGPPEGNKYISVGFGEK